MQVVLTQNLKVHFDSIEFEMNSVPVNNAWLDDIIEMKNDNSVSQVSVEIVDTKFGLVHFLQGIYPIAIC